MYLFVNFFCILFFRLPSQNPAFQISRFIFICFRSEFGANLFILYYAKTGILKISCQLSRNVKEFKDNFIIELTQLCHTHVPTLGIILV